MLTLARKKALFILLAALCAFAAACATAPDDSQSGGGPRAMTFDDVRDLAERGEALTLAEIMVFEGVDNLSGLYGWRVDIDEEYALQASGGSPEFPVFAAVLFRKSEDDLNDGIDIRYYDVDAFVNEGERRLARPTPPPPLPSASPAAIK